MKHIIFQVVSLVLIVSLAVFAAGCAKKDTSSTEENTTAAETRAEVTQGETTMTQSQTVGVTTAVETTKPTAAAATMTVDTALRQEIINVMKHRSFSGAFRVSKGGKLVCEGTNGMFSIDGDQPLSLDNRFLIASISKQFCATCILLLRNEGKLSLDDTLAKYYPEYARAGDITLKQMLTMRSGIFDYVSNDGAGFDAYIPYDFSENASEDGNHQAVRDWIFSQELLFEPGERFYYSDSNYFLLAEIVQRISGKSYGDVLRERIFKPLGMNDTGVAEELAHDEKTVPPFFSDKSAPREIYTIGATFGNGGIITTVADMDKWLTALRKHTILDEDSYKEMTTDYSPDDGHYGYGISLNDDGSLWHEGMADSFASYALTDPEEEVNVFIVTNNAYARFSEFRGLVNEILNDVM